MLPVGLKYSRSTPGCWGVTEVIVHPERATGSCREDCDLGSVSHQETFSVVFGDV